MPKPLYIIVHTPKTAGTTLRRNFELNSTPDDIFLYTDFIGLKAVAEGDVENTAQVQAENNTRWQDFLSQKVTDKTRFLFGHRAYYGIHELLPEQLRQHFEPRYIVFFRDPVKRIISLYHFLRKEPQLEEDYKMIEENWSLEQFIESPRAAHNAQLGKLLSIGTPSAPIDSRTNKSLVCPDLRAEHLEQGKDRLRQFWFAASTQTFDDDASYLYGKLGFLRYRSELILNATSKPKSISDDTLARIAAYNQLDIELHEFAIQLREEFVKRHAREYTIYKTKAHVLRALHKKYSSFKKA